MDNRDYLKKVVENIFNNWTALQLAVEHSMGGPLSRQTALEFLEHLVDYCGNTSNIEQEDIEDYLEDVMDQEFNTVCEDNSISEIASIIYKFIILLKEGNLVQYEQELNSLPKPKQWLSSMHQVQPETVASNMCQEPETSVTNEIAVEDAEWTQVKSRRRK